MNKEKTRGYTVRFKPSNMDKVHKYMEMSNISKTKFFDELLEEFFNNKVLEKGFLELEMPYYANTSDLIKKRVVNATTEKPTSNLKNQMIIFKVPTNLDSWSTKYNTFCSEHPNHHQGIRPIVALFPHEDGIENIKILYHVFKITYPYEGIKETSLEISILSPDEIEIFLNQYPEEIVEDLLIEFKQLEKEVSEDLALGLTAFEVFKNIITRKIEYPFDLFEKNDIKLLKEVKINFQIPIDFGFFGYYETISLIIKNENLTSKFLNESYQTVNFQNLD